MTIKTIIKMGNPKLFKKSKPIHHFNTPKLHAIIQDLKDTMQHYNGVGIAAPQIGYLLQIIMFGFKHNSRYPNEAPIPETILINPKLVILTDKKEGYWEGCLSVPGLRGFISRPVAIEYTGYTPEGRLIKRKAEGFHARVIQHEYDHIHGILFPQKITNFQKFGFEEEINKD